MEDGNMKAIITRKIPNSLKPPIVTSNGGWKEIYDSVTKELREHPFVDITEEVDIEFPELEARLKAIEEKIFSIDYKFTDGK